MPRPRKCRKVGFIPHNSCFYPQVHSEDEVILTLEEFEAIRLADLLELEQDGAAESMDISRGTFQRVVHAARHKIADALVHGKTIRIEGGHYKLARGGGCCCKRHSRMQQLDPENNHETGDEKK